MDEEIEYGFSHIQFLTKCMRGRSSREVALVILLDLNIPTSLLGFDYLLHAIEVFSEDPTLLLSKGIYPAIADCYDYYVSYEEIEKNIRHAIKRGWSNRDEVVWRSYFSVPPAAILKRPTNYEFITRTGRVLQLWRGCSEEGDNGTT